MPLTVAAVCVVGGIDTTWKAAALVSGHGAMDAPSSWLRPLATLLVGLAAFAGVLLLPRCCLPGALLVAGGVTSNLVSLVLWRAVPNPLSVHLAGGVLHLNLADICITGGALSFLAATFWTLWRMPDDRLPAW